MPNIPKQDDQLISTEIQLAIAIDGLAEHFVLFDAEDRIILANKAWQELNKDVIETTLPGTKFVDHLRAAINKGLIPESTGCEEKWLQERMHRHYHPSGSFEVARQDGRWILINEQRLPNNGIILIISDITAQKKVEEELQKSDERFQAFIRNLPAKMHIKDTAGRYIMINPVCEKLFGVRHEEVIGKTVADIFPESMREKFNSHDKAVLETGLASTVEEEFQTNEGSHTFLTVKFPILDANGNIAAIGASGIDITERKQAESSLRIAAIAMNTQEAIAITDANQTIIKVNQAFTKITGYSAEEAIGNRQVALLKSGRHDEHFYQAMSENLNHIGYWQGEIWHRHKNSEIHPHRLNISAVKNENDQVTHYVAAFTDITQQKKAEEIIRNVTFFDPLTKLANRRLLQDRLQNILASSARNQRHGAILYIDLDNFKELNDSKGHGTGDQLLIEVGRRLQDCVREDDTVARLGADEFAVLLIDLNAADDQAALQAESIADKIRVAINQTVDLQGYEYHGSSSIGISMFQGDDLSAEELLKRADTAMYQAKLSGRDSIRFFDPATHVAIEARISFLADLRSAIPDNQFRLYYQMQVDRTGRIIGAEGLLRWQHPVRGLVPPLQFIPLAEETGLIIPIGQWVLETACRQLKEWESDPKTRHLQLAINVSARQFHETDYVERVFAVMEKAAIDPDKLKFELTESLVLENVNDAISKMQALKEIGTHLSMDDFGTGHSSLSYLTQLPLDQIKIDQSFVRNISIKSTDAVIVQTIIGMANNLSMEVIAEGVETNEQRDFLERSGCFNYQGYFFGKPVPVKEFSNMLLKNNSA